MDEELIKELVDAYRQMVPIDKLFGLLHQNEELYYLSWDGQQEVLHHLIYDPITSTYPPCRRYTLRFLQRYLEELESNPSKTMEISDDLCKEISMLIGYSATTGWPPQQKEVDVSQDLYHLTYRAPQEYNKLDQVITCRVARCCNEVGLKLWEAGLYLAEFSLLNPTVFRGRKILELGSGIGLAGLFIAACAQPKSIYMTDYAGEVLVNLAYNVDINKRLWEEDSSSNTTSQKMEVKSGKLDWENFTEDQLNDIQAADMLLCGDCAYDKAVFPALIRVLNVFFDVTTTPTRNRKAIFAITHRNEQTFQLFLKYLEHEGISWTDMKEDCSGGTLTATMPDNVNNHFFEYDGRESIYLYQLYKNLRRLKY